MNIGIVGAAGRMGQMLCKHVTENPGTTLIGATERPRSEEVGNKVAGVTITGNADALFGQADAVIDFTVPDATIEHAGLAAKHGKILIIGTTGLSPDQDKKIAGAAEKTTIVYAPNFSLGVNLALAMVEKSAEILPAEFKIHVDDVHHVHKKDSPSGTAIGLAKAAAGARGQNWEEIGITSKNEGEIVGTHTVSFTKDDEIVELKHVAIDRAIFAKGAIHAALWAKDQEPGLYSMRDVLGL